MIKVLTKTKNSQNIIAKNQKKQILEFKEAKLNKLRIHKRTDQKYLIKVYLKTNDLFI